jgi:hypothetical protein
MIWTLHIKLLSGRWADKLWTATIALDASSTLEDLHLIIQKAVDFRLGHLTGRPGFPGRSFLAREGVRSETVR